MSVSTTNPESSAGIGGPTEHTMPSWDGTPLFYRAWLPNQKTDKAIVLDGYFPYGRLVLSQVGPAESEGS